MYKQILPKQDYDNNDSFKKFRDEKANQNNNYNQTNNEKQEQANDNYNQTILVFHPAYLNRKP